VPLLGWWLTGLFDLDEGFYAAVVAEMNRRGEWVTPYYNGQAWFEKPILLYWFAKPAVMVFGDMIGPRLPSVLSAIGCYLLLVSYARKRLSEEVATWSVIVLGSSLVFVAVGRLMMTDMPLALTLTAAMLTFWESLRGNPKLRLATAALLGIAVLAKGPVSLILFALIAGWTYWRERDLRPAFRGYWLPGTALLFAVIAVWYVPAYLASGQLFVQKFLIEQNIGRFTGGDKAHTIKAAWAYILYIPVIFIGMLPWSIWLWKAWPRKDSHFVEGEGGGKERGFQVDVAGSSDPAFLRFLAAWAAIIFLLFSASSAKLPHYVLPVFPPLALILGIYFAKKWHPLTPKKLAFPIAWVLVLAIVANGGFLWWYQKSGQMEAHAFARYINDNSLHNIPKSVAIFQMPRRKKELRTGTAELQETSLPSLLLYLNATVNEAETPQEVVDGKSHWLLTRKDRITDAVRSEFAALGKKLEPIGPTPKNFELYEIR
jgi:4-amino-4-deoxy-L-arabinose transferase-like glycosyltransferase